MRGLLIGAGIFGVGAYLAKRKPSPAQPVLDEAAEPEPVEESSGFSLGYAPTIPVREAFDPDVWASSKVTPARFYPVRKGDTIPKIAARLVRETALDAARGRKMPKDTARQWADQLSRSHGLIRQAERDSIRFSGATSQRAGQPVALAHHRENHLATTHGPLRHMMHLPRYTFAGQRLPAGVKQDDANSVICQQLCGKGINRSYPMLFKRFNSPVTIFGNGVLGKILVSQLRELLITQIGQ